VDGLKFPRRSEEDLYKEIKIVKAIRNYININFVLEKCAKIAFKKRWGPY
jgi:hypothetical protein